MSGAIAGTAVLHMDPEKSGTLQIVALTVNNACNLACDHCYLQDGVNGAYVSDEVLDRVIDSSASHVALVGKEPTIHMKYTERAIKKLVSGGKTVSMITNGLLLGNMSFESLLSLSYLDVSMDGGPNTYSRGDFTLIEEYLTLHPQTNILHTLYHENLDNLNDMTNIKHTGIMMFSPYLVTENFGHNSVHQEQLENIIDAVERSQIGNNDEFILIDKYHLEQAGIPVSDDMPNGVFTDENPSFRGMTQDPLEFGIIRVNYDGTVLKPSDSIHPQRYRRQGLQIGDLDKQYAELLETL